MFIVKVLCCWAWVWGIKLPVTEDIDYCIFSPQFSSKFPEKILRIWLILLSSRQANLFLGWLHCSWGCLAFKRLNFPLSHMQVPLCLGWHTLKSCVTWAQAALELCMLFFIFTGETGLAQLCSHCKCCCFSILSINAAVFLMKHNIFFVGSLQDGCCILYKFMFFIWKRNKGRKS